jgi:hypothetical protein
VSNVCLSIDHNTTQYKVYIFSGYYPTHEELICEINKRIKDECSDEIADGIKFSVEKFSKRTVITKQTHKGYTIDLDSSLKTLLGFDDETLQCLSSKEYDQTFPREEVKDLSFVSIDSHRLKSLYNIDVYTDIIQPSIVSDIEAPLLRVVPITETDHWIYQHSSFVKRQFIPLAQKQIRSVTIYLRDPQGKPVLFTSGQTIVTLEIRPVKLLSVK